MVAVVGQLSGLWPSCVVSWVALATTLTGSSSSSMLIACAKLKQSQLFERGGIYRIEWCLAKLKPWTNNLEIDCPPDWINWSPGHKILILVVPPEMIGPLFSACVCIAFTLREHILVISGIGNQQRQDPMSEESDLALKEMEGGSTRTDTR